jgi:hypothetical protein
MKTLLLACALTLTASAQVLLPGDSATLFPEPPASITSELGSLGWLVDPDKNVAWLSLRGPAEHGYVVRDRTGLVVELIDDFVLPYGQGGHAFQETANLPEEVWLRVYLSDELLLPGDPIGAFAVRSVRFGFDRPGAGLTEFDVPEPAAWALISGLGLIGFALGRRSIR